MSGTASIATVSRPSNVWLDSLIWGTKWDSGAASGGPTVVSVYLGGENGAQTVSDGYGDTVTAQALSAEERAAMTAAMSLFERVCNIDFRMVGSASDADLVWAKVNSFDGQQSAGWAQPPGVGIVGGEARSLVAINYEAYAVTAGQGGFLARGGYDFNTFTHELGHAVGLAHPHDDGGGSAVFPGLEDDPGGFGLYGMNQTIFTMMSYNGGWATGPQGVTPSSAFGQDGGPMALDIAALQRLYGANMTYRTGDDTYRLPSGNKVGTCYTCLWDAGGTDTMIGAEARDNSIDLRPASLKAAPGGGGWVSFAEGIHGGFTIARGVVIENAAGGAKADTIRGNEAANRLEGLDGNDRLRGDGGNDILLGGAGADRLDGGSGQDRLTGAAGTDVLTGGEGRDRFVFLGASDGRTDTPDRITDFERGSDRLDLSAVDGRSDLSGLQDLRLDLGGAFAAGEVRQVLSGSDLRMELNLRGDATPEMLILLTDVGHRLAAGDILL